MKKPARRTAKKAVAKKPVAVHAAKKKESKSFLVLLKSWMFVVMFALMLGIGAIVGTFMSQQMDMGNPQVAGAQVEAR